MKICVLYGGCSSERSVSILSAKSILKTLSDSYSVYGYDFNGNYDELYENIKNSDLVFNALHGGDGENGVMQKFLEDNNIIFTGSDSKSSEKSMDKHISKSICYENNILTPDWLYFIDNYRKLNDFLKFNNKSIVVKPSNEGSSIGLSIVNDFNVNLEDKTKELDESIAKCIGVSNNVLIEEYIPGRELTVGILGDKIFPVLEIEPSNKFYDYECKYIKGKCKYTVPAENIEKKLKHSLQELSLNIYRLLNCRHYARIDFRLTLDKRIYFLEINTLPGFTDTSLFPMAAKSIGIDYKKLLLKIVELSKK
tara:strand:+ start:2373 stop:3299 length:927 start_codon:yes stop_codon:yes gene_type:complete